MGLPKLNQESIRFAAADPGVNAGSKRRAMNSPACRTNRGCGYLYDVCVQDMASFRAGEVVKLDHELDYLEKGYASLEDLMCRETK
jgi:hypothetical protein